MRWVMFLTQRITNTNNLRLVESAQTPTPCGVCAFNYPPWVDMNNERRYIVSNYYSEQQLRFRLETAEQCIADYKKLTQSQSQKICDLSLQLDVLVSAIESGRQLVKMSAV